VKRKALVSFAFLGILACLSVQGFNNSNELTIKGNLRVLSLEGTPYERGFTHGKALKTEIHALVKLWKASLEKSTQSDPDIIIKKFLDKTGFQMEIKKWTPELWEEVKGIAEGSGVDLDTMYAFQLVDEMWVLDREILSEHCTTVGTIKTKETPAIVAQNLDIPIFYHGFQTLFRIKDPDRDMETLLFTFPGFIAANGINSRSVAVVVNAVQQLEHARDGLPVAFVIRGILQRETYDDAVKFIKSIKHGAPQNYMIGGSEKVASYECSTTNAIEFLPFKGARFTYHTNHPLKNRNYTPQFLQFLDRKNVSPDEYEFSCPRFQSLQYILKDNSSRLDVDVMKDIFSSRQTGINNGNTFGCTIMVLGSKPELHISPGRPDVEPFQVFRFMDE
jgi:isopenicillin-N N-acyltransferase-like protein